MPTIRRGKIIVGNRSVSLPPPVTNPAQSVQGYGYAFHGRVTDGGDVLGANAPVSNFTDLKSAWESSSPYNIELVNGFTHDGGNGTNSIIIAGGNNKTLWSKNGQTVKGVCFRAFDKSNIKFQNVKIREVGYDQDGIYMARCTGIWVDHCEFGTGWKYWNDPDSNIEGGVIDFDGIADFSDCDLMTFSNNQFLIHDKMMLGGGGRFSFYNNYIYQIRQRAPNISDNDAHLFNNYWNDSEGGGMIQIAGTSKAIIENNYFLNMLKTLHFSTTYAGSILHSNYLTSNIFVNSQTVATASYPPVYQDWTVPYTLPAGFIKPASEVPSYVLANSGCTLNL